jgi:glycosyltransferase involved in cell wall biosynthesis
MLEAIRIVSAKHRVVLKIVGDVFGEERLWLEEFISRFGLQEVVIRTGWLPYEQVGAALESCHLGLLAFSECPNHIIAAPNKIYNYLMYGIPFVGPRFVRILQGMAYDEGVCALADPRDPHSYADAICRLIEDRPGTLAMGARALEASRTKYRWQHMEPKLFALYERVLGG